MPGAPGHLEFLSRNLSSRDVRVGIERFELWKGLRAEWTVAHKYCRACKSFPPIAID